MTGTGVMIIRRALPSTLSIVIIVHLYTFYIEVFVFGGVVPVLSRLFHI